MEKGPRFLKERFNLHSSEEVESAVKRTRKSKHEKVPQEPEARITNYLDRFKEIIERKDEHGRERGIEALKKVIYDKFVIKEDDVPESHFEQQREIARRQGHGDVEITDQMRDELTEIIITDQKSSLDTWVDYFASEDAMYPDWLKYYAFRSMLKLGEYHKEKKKFTKRTKSTVKPFPDLNREALAYVLDAIEKDNPDLSNLDPEKQEEFEKLLQNANFAKLYSFAIEQVTPESQELLTNTQGEWVKYNKNSDHMPLVESLQGHGTGWCTAGESTAKKQLEGGDFYVYYSHDKNGKPSIPRSAIRMQGDEIGEVRGIAEEQNLDPHIGEVVDEKLEEFGSEGEKYQKKSADMKQLTELEKKHNAGQDLTKDEIMFLYEVKQPIKGFGYQKDPRIQEIQQAREARKDLSVAFACKPEQISFSKDEALSGDIKFHFGDLNLGGLQSAEGLILPESVGDYLDLSGLQSAEGLTLPESVGGYLDLRGLQSADKNLLKEKYPEHAKKI